MTTAIIPNGGLVPAIPSTLTPGGAQTVFRATLDALARPGLVRRLPSARDEPLAGHVPAALLPLLALADLSTPACVVGGPAQAAGAAGTAGPAGVNRVPGTGPGDPDGNGNDGNPGGGDRWTAWDEIVRVATNAPRAPLSEARLVTALRPLSAAELAVLRTGTAAAPEDGALACLAVSGIAIVDGADFAASADSAAAGADPADQGGTAHGANRGGTWLRLTGPGVPGTRTIIVTGLPAGFAATRDRLVSRFPAGADLLLIAPDGAMTGIPRTTAIEARPH